ncbi:MAG: Coenzyme F420 hydrogenase/dehydrogenase, beta subunit C-terminal domain [Actinobacteria bacterium]|nr:Coenzyme F420 hydrogenase/dehydrogenase, beta subunit C-terminal domain [Actinomycetota bacterium]
MNVQHVYDEGLCMQCGTCEGICPVGAVTLTWDLRAGYRVSVDEQTCTDCGRCHEACPGPGLDFSPGAWWRERNAGACSEDFLGPWRRLWFGWASDARVRHAGASGGVATALMQAALESGAVDAVVAARMSAANPLAAEGAICRSPEEVAAKYDVVAINTVLRRILDEPGRYALVGLPCHIQGLRLAQRRSRRLRERVTLALGVFCGFTNEPRATAVLALQAGLDPAELREVSYRGPGWPGGMRLVTRQGTIRRRAYPDYFDRSVAALTPPRCRICPDALAELADVSVGDAWLDRFNGTDGVSDIIARTPAGERLVETAAGYLVLQAASPADMVASQSDTRRAKRGVCRGRLWLRSKTRQPLPAYPGLELAASPGDRLRGVADAAQERLFRSLVDRRYPN